ncbi:MAG: hypothetical protein ABIH72_02515 [archaeon]
MKEKLINSFWREGKYIDSWSIIHLLSGFGLGVILLLILKLPFLNTILVTISLLILAEILEPAKETIENRISDVLIGFLGFILAFIAYLNLNKEILLITSTFMFLIWGTLNIIGWKTLIKSNKS